MNNEIRMVLVYTESDGCTFSAEVVLPILYESTEAALVDFESCFEDAKASKDAYGFFDFAGHQFHTSSFIEGDKTYLPSFLTIDEWFANV